MFKNILGLCAIGILTAGGLLADISITNPSFENPSLGTGPGAYAYITGSNNGWIYGAGGNGVAANGSNFNIGTAPDGTQVLFLQGGAASASQSLSGFQSSVTYTLHFDWASRDGFGGDAQNQVLQVSLGGVVLFTGDWLNNGTTYVPESITFTTTSGSQVLQFSGLSPQGDSTDFVDNVSITNSATTVPEPGIASIYGAFGLGLIGLVAVIRRRKNA